MIRLSLPVALLLVCMLLVGVVSCDKSVSLYQYSDFGLGTVVNITHYSTKQLSSSALSSQHFSFIKTIERRFTTSEQSYETSELLAINRTPHNTPQLLSDDLFELINLGVEYSIMTDGLFNIAIWPLSRLWDYETLRDSQSIPDEQSITTALTAIDYTNVILSEIEKTITFTQPGMGIDVGGIAKGWVAEQLMHTYQSESDIVAALLDLGGNIVTINSKPDGSPWKIGIQHPARKQGELVGILSFDDSKSVVTSGAYERYFDYQGKRYHHIIDPLTGFPTDNNLASVTIFGSNPTQADAFSTAVFNMGLEQGYQFIIDTEGIEGILISADGTILITPALQNSFTLTDNTFTVFTGDAYSQR